MKRERRTARFTQVALSLGTLTLLVNPLVFGLFLRLDPDASIYILTFDAVFLVLLAFSVLYVRTKRDGFRRAFFVALCLAPFLVVGSELYLSVWRLQNIDSWRSERIEGVYEPHQRLGWRPIPNSQGRHVSDGNFDATYEIDELGRKSIPKSFDDGPTLHFFGDSYTFGHGADNDDTALNVLARGFARAKGFNVANYAVMAYGLEQMITRLKMHRDLIKPGDYVIFTPTSFDLLRNMIHKRFLCQFLIRKSAPVGKVTMRDDGTWTTTDLDQACNSTENRFLHSNFLFGLVYNAIRDRTLQRALIENADAILDEAESLTRDAGATFAVVFLAAPWECRKESFDFDLTDLRSDHVSMLEHCPSFNMHFPTDPHWSPEGHRWVAGFLEEQLAPALH